MLHSQAAAAMEALAAVEACAGQERQGDVPTVGLYLPACGGADECESPRRNFGVGGWMGGGGVVGGKDNLLTSYHAWWAERTIC